VNNPFVIGRRPETPNGWCAVRVKDVTRYVNRGVAPTYSEAEADFVAVSQKCVVGNGLVDFSLGRPMAEDTVGSAADARLVPGDIIVNSTGTGTLGRVGIVSETAEQAAIPIADGHVTIIRTDQKLLLPDFLAYLLGTNAFSTLANECLAVGSTNQMELGRDAIRTLGVLIPSLSEQRDLVRLLDQRLKHIDEMIAEQETIRSLILLRRSAEIDRFIEHGGLDSHLRPIDSPWIDAIPDSWQFMPLKFCVERVTVGIVINPSHYYEDEGFPVLRGMNVRPGKISADDLVFMSDESNQFHSKSILRAGDVVVVRTGAAGSAAVIPDWAVGGNIVDLLHVRPGSLMRPKFVELLLNSRLVQRQVASGSVGALQAHFNTAALSNAKVVVPPLAEQDRVLAHLEVHLDRYDNLIAETLRQKILLTEHRQAVITAAVTGHLLTARSAA
jgi:type I restriction enzyme S subunit